MATATQEGKQPKALPVPNSDFYELAETLGAEEQLEELGFTAQGIEALRAGGAVPKAALQTPGET